MVTALLPPTVNMHVVGHCNYGCLYCYARFDKAKEFLPLPTARPILEQLREHGARRITFAGGEPMLHPDLEAMLRACAELGLITSVVTNGSRLDTKDACRRFFPWVRWLVLSCDSHVRTTNLELGRAPKKGLDIMGQTARVEQLAAWVHEWNARRPLADHVRLKVNIVVTSVNADEDPAPWLVGLKPERVKLLQCCIIPGENDDAERMKCSEAAFKTYAARLADLPGIKVVAETSEDLLDSYAMIDPLGRFRQAHASGYVESQPIQEVGADVAWQQVGGCNLERFHARGGVYEDGEPSHGLMHPIIGIEGLDASGKSTVVRELAAKLGAAVVMSPPAHMREQRDAADGSPPAARRAWYWSANREAMKDATDLVFRGTPVVMDRCFASTAAYGAAELGRVATPRDVPRDVPRPDLVFLLTLPEEVRQQRLRARGGARTAEEDRLTADDDFRQRVLDGYARLGAHPVDASGTIDAVVAAIVHKVDRGTTMSSSKAGA